jgi:hypothetical protein
VSAVLVVHLVAVGAAALAAPPSSPLMRSLAGWFAPYHQLVDQGYSYRYYAPEPPPTPVVEARLTYRDGRPGRTVRIPDRAAWPRLHYQRQLALAHAVDQEWRAAQGGAASVARAMYAPAFARHVGRLYGCDAVELFVIVHAIPPLGEVQHELESGASAVDLDAERYYETPQWVGEFPCDGS